MNKDQVRERILEVGIIPVVYASSVDEAEFAAEAVSAGGIPIVELTVTAPDALEMIAKLVQSLPETLVGAGTVLDAESARRALEAGAEFLVTTGVDLEIVGLGLKENKFVMAGALTPTEVLAAWNAGADFVKIFPCSQVGGPRYIRALKGPFPGIPLVPTGGVALQTAGEFIQAGSAALGVGVELIMKQALKSRAREVIRDAASRFAAAVKEARSWRVTPPDTLTTRTQRASAVAGEGHQGRAW